MKFGAYLMTDMNLEKGNRRKIVMSSCLVKYENFQQSNLSSLFNMFLNFLNNSEPPSPKKGVNLNPELTQKGQFKYTLKKALLFFFFF